jgi:hypothetical protein
MWIMTIDNALEKGAQLSNEKRIYLMLTEGGACFQQMGASLAAPSRRRI